MTEITRVPLQPIARGSLTKLWLGVIAAVLLGAGIAWAAAPKGVELTEMTAGTGANPTAEDVILVNYKGMLADGTVFDQGQGVPLPLQGMIPGFTEGALKMQKGGKYRMVIPADKAYGAEEKRNPMTNQVVIPANSDLTFEVDLIDFMPAAAFEQRMQAMQQMMQQQQQSGGGGGGGGGGAPAPGAPPR